MHDAPAGDRFGIDRFPVGCIAVDGARIIRFANAHAAAQVGRPRDALIGLHLEALLTPASRIFCDSYVFPILLAEGRCEEVALTVVTGGDGRAPVVVNISVHEDDSALTMWAMMRADKRENLQQELLTSKDILQKQTRSLKQLATRDELTGLINRREFTRMVAELMSAADRAGASVTTLLLDIDRFKAVNDTYGHQVGDDVLAQIGAAFLGVVRAHELAGRYGGEEFIFAIAAADGEAARSFSRRLHAAAASVTGPAAPVTASIGLCCRPTRSERSFEDMVKAADRALYRAKQLGRNRSMIETGGDVQPYD